MFFLITKKNDQINLLIKNVASISKKELQFLTIKLTCRTVLKNQKIKAVK